MFGKSTEDYIGLIIEVGNGKHNGTVKGRVYFKCRDGKGVMVRPKRIVQDLGTDAKLLTKEMINDPKGKKLCELALKEKEKIQNENRIKKIKSSKSNKSKTISKDLTNNLSQYGLITSEEWSPAEYDVEDHTIEFLPQKLHYSKTLLDKHKNEKAKKKKMVSEIDNGIF